ncbi:hypothetical protein SF123566_0266 [Shigella flexneri 1235-66]|nr:hypothetical protein SF123566_0266 [Shigella flexneri 1235-66]
MSLLPRINIGKRSDLKKSDFAHAKSRVRCPAFAYSERVKMRAQVL